MGKKYLNFNGQKQLVEKLWTDQLDDRGQLTINIEKAITEKKSLIILGKNKKQIAIYPYRIVYLDGELTLIGEEVKDKMLISLAIIEVQTLECICNNDYIQTYSVLEMDDFIAAIRVISGNEMRLVLKIKDYQSINLSPQHHFLERPYMTTNLRGDLIWGASVEPCEDLYKWIYGHRDSIEILDPGDIIIGYQQFCQDKEKSLKNVS